MCVFDLFLGVFVKIYCVLGTDPFTNKHYLTKLKNDPVYQAKQRESSKKHYYKHQEVVKEKVRNYKKEKKELELLERLYEIQQENMIDKFYGDVESEVEDEDKSNAEQLIIKKLVRMGLNLE
jgi:transcriptional regulator of NAD metabolism